MQHRLFASPLKKAIMKYFQRLVAFTLIMSSTAPVLSSSNYAWGQEASDPHSSEQLAEAKLLIELRDRIEAIHAALAEVELILDRTQDKPLAVDDTIHVAFKGTHASAVLMQLGFSANGVDFQIPVRVTAQEGSEASQVSSVAGTAVLESNDTRITIAVTGKVDRESIQPGAVVLTEDIAEFRCKVTRAPKGE